jgi:ribosomal protein S18 acetylase RimI-like enzyme
VTPTLYLRRAELDDVDTLLRWRRDLAEWIAASVGSDQWSTPYPREQLVMWVERGETVMASLNPGGEPVATITASTWADPALWTPEELRVPAWYLYKANVVREHAGKGIGRTLIAWARTSAAKAGARTVRCDVWSTNTRLQGYYRGLGFTYLRTVPGVNSGALFEITAAITPDLPVVGP